MGRPPVVFLNMIRFLGAFHKENFVEKQIIYLLVKARSSWYGKLKIACGRQKRRGCL